MTKPASLLAPLWEADRLAEQVIGVLLSFHIRLTSEMGCSFALLSFLFYATFGHLINTTKVILGDFISSWLIIFSSMWKDAVHMIFLFFLLFKENIQFESHF